MVRIRTLADPVLFVFSNNVHEQTNAHCNRVLNKVNICLESKSLILNE